MPDRQRRRVRAFVVGTLIGIVTAGAAHAQFSPNQFGGQDRADAVSRLIVLGVQQAISSLPPTSGQSFVYDFDPKKDTFVRGQRLGPTVFRSTESIGKGTLSLRVGASYFELAQTFSPVQYLVQFNQPYVAPDGVTSSTGVVGFGVKADAEVGVLNFSAGYGLTNRLEFIFNLPVTIVDARASQLTSTSITDSSLPPSQALVAGPFIQNPLSSNPTVRAEQINGLSREFRARLKPQCLLGPDQCLTFRRDSFTSLGFTFNEGTHAGVGRMSLGGKALLYTSEWVRLAFMTEFFVPSPNQAEFAGSDTPSILPRAVATLPLASWLRLHTDVGYDYDFDDSELRRFVWDTGASFPVGRFAFDVGVGGSKYDTAIRWTPSTAQGMADPQLGVPSSTLSVLGDNQLGDNFIDFLGGVKVRLASDWVVSGAVTVPVNNEGFQPAALGTVALEYYFRAAPQVTK